MTIIMIDPGHGGSDPGAQAFGYQEKNFNLQISLKIRDYLQKKYAVKVLMTRTTDQTVSLSERTNMANIQNVDYFCSIHVNAGGGSGFESYIYNGPVPPQTIRYQAIIHDQIINKLKNKYSIKDRGKKRANFHVLRETKMPAILLETLFIDHQNDIKLLTNPSFIQDYSAAVAEGLAKALNLSAKDPKPPLSNDKDVIYKVIAGSFKERKNAEKRVSMLKSKKIDAFIVPAVINGTQFYRVQAGAYKMLNHAKQQVKQLKNNGIKDAFIASEIHSENSKRTKQPPDSDEENLFTDKGFPINGHPFLSGQMLNRFVLSMNENAPLLGEDYYELSKIYNIRGDIALAQAIHETNYFRFTGTVKPEQNNFAGIGATGPNQQGARFSSAREGVLAQLQHLYAYASTDPLPKNYPLVDPRFHFVTRGSAKTWQELNGKWAVPGNHYGQSILKIYQRMIDFSKDECTKLKQAVQQSLEHE
ncbi:N-acetylmuramoyl-L-alanine amidase [Aeribacillus alveayuensis]|uniref:SPOR domain-containing protein n=1 Tax=Aeribacillus alveayuensis TaxID=279215 RepID=A0ABT9VR28_9BACI|nr:hypothetical protein [Bacillus alveayuensis]